MRLIVTSFLFVVALSSCSSSKSYAWRGESKLYLDKYKEMMLKGDTFQASYYFKDALKYAKLDTSLNTVAMVYLNQCAMELSINKKSDCSYIKIQSLIKNREIESFYQFLYEDKVDSVENLGKYEKAYLGMQNSSVNVAILDDYENIASKFIVAMVWKYKSFINREIAQYMVDQASENSLKGVMLVWMKILKDYLHGEEKKALEDKIILLGS
jgi:hypothetical protein